MNETMLNPGCWVDSSWGHYGPAKVLLDLLEAGWQPDDDYMLALIAEAYLAMMGPSTLPSNLPDGWSNNARDVLYEAQDRAIEWAQKEAPDGHTVGWREGDFGCWPIDTER